VISLARAVLACFILTSMPLDNCWAAAATTQPASRAATAPSDPEPNEPRQYLYVPQSATKGRKATIGSLDSRTGFAFQVEVVNEHAAIRTLKLSEYFTNVADKRAFESDPDAYTKRINAAGADDGHYTLLNHVQKEGVRYLPLATTVYVTVDGEKTVSRLKTHNRWQMAPKAVSGDNKDAESISFQCTAYRGPSAAEAATNPFIRLTKTYTVRKADHTVHVSLKIENLSSKKITVRLDQAGPTGAPRENLRADERFAVWGLLGEENSVNVQVELKTKLTPEEHFTNRTPVGTTAGAGEEPAVLWIGQGNKFFASMLYLRPEVDRKEAANYNASVYYQGAYESPDSLTHITGLDIPAMLVEPKATKTVDFDLFAGPKRRAMFTDTEDKYFKQQYTDLNYAGAITLNTCGMCTFDWMTSGLMWLLDVFAMVAFGNYGLAIFILVLLVRLVLHPLTKKGQVSMVKMQKMQPKMAKLKEKFADDKETLNKEMMKMYKEQGATPILGCLPMLLQMPIWIALYGGLNAAVELRHSGLLPFWITDLAAPDALFSFGAELPLVGTTFNLLPLLLTVAMFLQAKMNPATSGPTSPEQATQQKMMRYMMPAMMLMIFYHAPSGLSLYIMTSISGGVLEQMYIRKHIAEKEAAEAAATTTVRVGGKGFRDSREKKPKSPYKTR